VHLNCRPCPSHSVCEVQRAVGMIGCCLAYRAQDVSFKPWLVGRLLKAATRQDRRTVDHSSSDSDLGKRVGLAIDKVIHHDNVIFIVIVRTWGGVPGRDPHASDPGVVIYDAEE
jgi:hypothetical protein